MTGFTYRGKHSWRDFRLRMRTKNRPVVPPKRVIEEEVPYLDGSLDFTEANGRAYYGNKVLELELSLVRSGLKQLNRGITEIVEWLTGGYDALVIDDMPYVEWLAMPVNVADIVPELMQVGKTIVQFKCAPFNQLIFSSLGIPLGSRVRLGDPIKIGFGAENYVDLMPGENEITLHNIGTQPTAPRIRFTGIGINSLRIEGENGALSYEGNAHGLVIDCAAKVCLSGKQQIDVTGNSAGEFLELAPGDNRITLSVNAAGSAVFEYAYQYLYGDVGFLAT